MADEKADTIIEKLLAVRDKKPGTNVQLTNDEVDFIVVESKKILINQPALLELEAPIQICGDIHGQYHDLLRMFEYCGFPPDANYLFLGDFVDRGKNGLECICLLLAYKIKYPENFFLLRGNHECASINRIYGFYDECKRRYNIKMWKKFQETFNVLPIAAVVDEKIFCVHAGISPDLQSMKQIQDIMRPTDVPDAGLLCDLMWSDPDADITGWAENDRGVSYTFGADVVGKFLQKHDFDLVVRAHQACLERMPGDRSLALATGRGTTVSYTQCAFANGRDSLQRPRLGPIFAQYVAGDGRARQAQLCGGDDRRHTGGGAVRAPGEGPLPGRLAALSLSEDARDQM